MAISGCSAQLEVFVSYDFENRVLANGLGFMRRYVRPRVPLSPPATEKSRCIWRAVSGIKVT